MNTDKHRFSFRLTLPFITCCDERDSDIRCICIAVAFVTETCVSSVSVKIRVNLWLSHQTSPGFPREKRVVLLFFAYGRHRPMAGTEDGFIGQRQNLFKVV